MGDLGFIPGLGRSPGGGHGNPLQYSGLENNHGQKILAGHSPQGLQRVGHDWVTKHSTEILSLSCLVGRPYSKPTFSVFLRCSLTELVAAVCASSLYIFSAQHLSDCHCLFSSLSLCSTGMMPQESSRYLIKYTSDIRLLKWIGCKCIQRIPNLHEIPFQSDWAAVARVWNLSKFTFLPQCNGGFHKVIKTFPSSAAIWTQSFLKIFIGV